MILKTRGKVETQEVPGCLSQDFRVLPTDDGDVVTILANEGDVRVITTIARGLVDDISPSKLATAKERGALTF
jgi:hypothetical protein